MAKRIFVATFGTRGDVEPFIALSKALLRAGYDVVLSAPPDFHDWIGAANVPAHAAGDPVREKMTEIARAIENDRFFSALARSKYEPEFHRLASSLVEGSEGADLLIYSPMLSIATCIAEARGIPAIAAYLQPTLTTGEFATAALRRLSYGRFVNRLSHQAADFMLWAAFRRWRNAFRREQLALKPLGWFHDIRSVRGKPVPQLFALSEALVPRPKDWPPHAHMTGNWFLDGNDGWTPSPELAAFLRAGPPPIYIGFGSMPLGLSESKGPVLLEALRLSGQRAVLARGWGGWSGDLAGQPGRNIHVIDSAPHRKLFPLMAGVVHHGGAGTTAAGLLAGRPTLVTPLMMDQFFFGNIVARHGAGPKPLPVKQWRADVLARRLRELTGVASYAARAREMSARMAREDGTTKALTVVDRVIQNI